MYYYNVKLFLRVKFFFLILFQITAEQPFYRAAVFEFHNLKKGINALEVANKNSEIIIDTIKLAKSHNADIVVFPEIGISTVMINKSEILSAATLVPAESPSLCKQFVGNEKENSNQLYQPYLINISCAASTSQIYVIVNIHEKLPCKNMEGCPPDGFKIFNTNVVFDREGAVVSRYRKYNTYNAKYVNSLISSTHDPELSTFKTDFNVTFGQFICFDILFKSPPLTLIEKGITDFLFPTYWFSELPYLSAVQVQLGFSYVNDINLLAANINYPTTSSFGSGIYAGVQGPLVITNFNRSGNTLLVANVPKFRRPGERYENVDVNLVIEEFKKEDNDTNEFLNLFDNFEPYTSELFNPNSGVFNKTICNNELCCHFILDGVMEEFDGSQEYYRYRAMVFRGTRLYGSKRSGVEVCGIAACTEDNIKSCGSMSSKSGQLALTFTNINISRTVDKDHLHFMTSVYTTDYNILDTSSFSYTIENQHNQKEIHLRLTKPRSDLFAFAIYGRDEKQDEKHN